jgi:hypothetical protein
MTRITTRYVVKNRAGEELVVPSLDDLHALYAHGFLADEDLVRQERSQAWVRAGDLPALHGVRELERDPRKVVSLVATVAVVVVLLVGLLRFLSR